MRKAIAILGLCLLIAGFLIFEGCGSSEKEETRNSANDIEKAAEKMADAGEEMAEKMQEGVGEMADALQKMGEVFSESVATDKVEPVDYKDLKDLLPESLAKMERTDFSGERTSLMGIKTSQAHAEFSSDDGQNISIEIIDMGSVKGIAAMARVAWAKTEFERETDEGYERTVEYKGFKAFEKYSNEDKSGEFNVLVADRFVVEVKGYQVEIKDITKALDKIDLKKLEKMKNVGVIE